MALTDRDIVITPNKGASTEPTITFTGADAGSSGTVTLRVLNSGNVGTLSFEGTSGQLLSITDSMSGTIFSVNDISGIPSLEVLDTGEIRLAEFNGYVNIPNTTNATSTTNGALRVAGGVGIAQDLRVGGTIYGNVSGTISSSSASAITNDPSNGSAQYLTFVSGTSGNLPIKVDSSALIYVPGTNRLGVGRSPSYSLDVAGQTSPLQTVARFGTAGQDVTITHSSPIIAANAYYNGAWYRSGAGLASNVILGPGYFDFQTSPTSSSAGSTISDFTTRFYVSNSGLVGVGTSSPDGQLDVRGSDQTIIARSDGTSSTWRGRILSKNSSANISAFLGMYGSAPGVFAHNYALTAWNTLYVNTTNSSDGGNVIIAGSGSVGIGTSPGYKVDISMTNNYMRINSNAGYGGIMMYQNGAARGYLGMAWGTNDYITGSTQGDLTLRAESDLILAARSGNNASQLFLSSNSNAYIGMGTNNPSGQLHIYKTAGSATEIRDMLKLETYRSDFTSIGGSAIVFKNQDGNNATNEARIKVVTENDGSLGINNEGSSSFIFNMTNGGSASDRVIFRGDGRVGIGTMTPSETLDVNGVVNVGSHITQGPLVSRPNVTWGASGTSTGAVIIRFPGGTGNYGMVHVVIDIYEYSGEHASTIIVGGHNWNGAWYNYGASRIGSYSKGVRVGVLGGQYTITLGSNGTTWSYGQVVVRKIQNGSYYSGIMDLSGTYTISQSSSSDASYTWISSNLIVSGSAGAGGWNADNDGAGSGLDADLLDGLQGTYYRQDWPNVDSGTRTNYTLGFRPPSGNYAGFYFSKSTSSLAASDAGYFLIRGGGDSFPPYTNEGITLVSDANSLNLFARGSSLVSGGNAWVRMGTGSTETFRLESNYSYSLYSSRAPIFYDSNNSGYYADFANSTTSVNQLGNTVYNQYGRGPTGLYSSTRLQLVFSMGTSYQLPAAGNTSGNLYGIAWSHPNAGSIGGANNLASHGMLILENGSFRGAWGGASLRNPGDIRGTIFYDYNDTGYYTDPNTNATAYGTRLRSGTLYGPNYTWGAYLLVGGNGKYSYGQNSSNVASVVTTDGNLHLDSGSGKTTYINYYDGSGVYFGNGGQGNVAYIASDGTFRSPIFYDYNNTGYYADIASTSYFNIINANAINITGNAGTFGEKTYSFSCSANGTQARRYEIARIAIDYNDWNQVGGMEIELHETYWSTGLIKKYAVYYGYVSSYGVQLYHYQGSSGNYARVVTSGEVVVSGDHRYISIYVDVRYYSRVTAILRTTRVISTSSTPGIGTTYVFSSPTVTNISDFTPDSQTYHPATMISGSDMRAPIFYDYNNTGYYVNPNGTSNIIRLDGDEINIDGGSRNNSNDATLYVTATNNNDWGVIINKYRSSATEYGLDIRMGSSYNYGLRVLGAGSEHARLSSDYFYHFSDVRTPIFYDSNNTGYYANMASDRSTNINGFTSRTVESTKGTYKYNTPRFIHTSDTNYWTGTMGWGTTDLNSVMTWGSGFFDTWSSPANSPGDTSHFVGMQTYHYVNGANSGYGWQLAGGVTDSLWWRHSWPSNSGWFKVAMYGNNTSTGSFYSTINYDSNDTSYYTDPNSWSRVYGVGSFYLRNNYDVATDHPYGIYFANGLSTAYAIYRESGSWTSPYPDLRIAFHTGIKMGANSGYNGMRFYDDYTMATQVMSINNGSDPLGANNVYVNNSLQAGSSLRAPIFYDSNNTGYYSNQASNSYFYRAYLAADVRTYYYYDRANTGYYVNPDSTSNLYRVYGVADMRSPIFYDYSNTAYYCDPNGTSRLGNIRMNNDMYILGSSPTIHMVDSDHRGSALHTNSNLFYILSSNGVGGESWSTNNGYWPFYIDLNNNNATFGGTIWAASEITAYSDAKLKKDVVTINDALDKVSNLRGVYYILKSDETNSRKVGVIAQEVQLVVPEIVFEHKDIEDTEGTLAVDYSKLSALLIEAVKEQQQIINKQDSMINLLSKKFDELVERINNL